MSTGAIWQRPVGIYVRFILTGLSCVKTAKASMAQPKGMQRCPKGPMSAVMVGMPAKPSGGVPRVVTGRLQTYLPYT